MTIASPTRLRSSPGHVVNHSGVEQQVLAGQQEVDDVVLRRPDGDAAADAQVAQDVQDLRVATEFLQQ